MRSSSTKVIKKNIKHRGERDNYTPDKQYGDRLLISNTADTRDLEDNKRVARALLDSFKSMNIKIRPHTKAKGVKNPELEINGIIADNKRIQSEKGVSATFNSAIKQGCKTVVLDLDAKLKRLRVNDLAKYLSRRNNDLPGGINECYIVFNSKSVQLVTRDKRAIIENLLELKERTSE